MTSHDHCPLSLSLRVHIQWTPLWAVSVAGHLFAVLRRAEQAVHQPFISVGSMVVQKSVNILELGRQTGWIQRYDRLGWETASP